MTATLRKDVKRLEREVETLKSRLTEAEALLRQNEESLIGTQKKDAQTRAQAAESDRQVETLKAELAQSAATIKDMQEELAIAAKAGAERQEERESLHHQLIQQATAHGELEAKLADVEAQLLQGQAKQEQLEGEVEHLEEQLAEAERLQAKMERDLQSEDDEQAAMISDLNRKLVEAGAQLRESGAARVQLEKEKQEIAAQLTEAKGLLHTREEMLAKVERELLDLTGAQQEAAESEQRFTTLQAQVDQQKLEIDDLRGKLATVKRAASGWLEERRSIQRELDVQTKAYSELQTKLARAEARLSQSQAIQAQPSEEAEATAELQARLERYQEQIRVLEARIREQAATIDNLHDELTAATPPREHQSRLHAIYTQIRHLWRRRT